MIAYIIVGFLIGPYAANLFPNAEDIDPITEIGILLLMFSPGMEIDVPDKKTLLFKLLVARGMRIILTLGLIIIVSFLVAWPWKTVAVIPNIQRGRFGVMDGWVGIEKDGDYVLQLTPVAGTTLTFNDSLLLHAAVTTANKRQAIILPLHKG
ncbi:MAG: cation:proton antiporter [Niabella sp.]